MKEHRMAIDYQWVVMRCAGKETVPLATKLTSNGVSVYAPYRSVRIRVPRTHKHVIKDCPILPSFLFIPATQEDDARGLLDREAGVMVIRASKVMVSNTEMDRMKAEISARMPVRRGVPKPSVPPAHRGAPPADFSVGDRARVALGPFKGYTARVVGLKTDEVELEFEDFPGRVCFSTFLLAPYQA